MFNLKKTNVIFSTAVMLICLVMYSELVAEQCNAPTGNKCLYVRAGASSGGNGLLWSTAWNEFDKIAWATVNPGDVIKVAQGNYTTKINPSIAGTGENKRILIQRATEAGYDGNVVLPGATITNSFITIDGVDRNKFKFTNPGGSIIYVNIPGTAGVRANSDYFELKNISYEGTPDGSCYAKAFEFQGSSSVSIQNSNLKYSHCHEDIIWWYGTGNLRIEGCYIATWISFCPTAQYNSVTCSHSDFVWTNNQGEKLEFRNNLVDGSFPTTLWPSGGKTSPYGWYALGNNIVFTVNGFNTREVSYNVFKDTSAVFQGTGVDGTLINNVFYRTGFQGASGVKTIANNIYAPQTSNQTTVLYGCAPIYSLYGPTMRSADICTTATNHNKWCASGAACDPKFLNPESILGQDGLPFTADDGFNLTAGSPAINGGLAFSGLTRDILGSDIQGAPDIGAYEYRADSSPGKPNNLRIQP